jgi:hypothetical protein
MKGANRERFTARDALRDDGRLAQLLASQRRDAAERRSHACITRLQTRAERCEISFSANRAVDVHRFVQ